MDKIVSIVSLAPQTRSKNDDDFSDRISSRYTVVILIVFAVLVSMNQYVGNPITCWAPVHFTGSHIKFANNYCWVREYLLSTVGKRDPATSRTQTNHPVLPMDTLHLTRPGHLFSICRPSYGMGSTARAGVDADNILETANQLSWTEKG